MTHFSGSYAPDDATFLLKRITMSDTPVSRKEQLIQSGQKHYSELLTRETLPTDTYLQLFHQAMRLNQVRLAQHLLILAENIVATRSQGITLVSLLRAGTPVGVLLKRILKHYFRVDVAHYSISIIRDIGLDENALRHILQGHAPETLVFIDGWTGKGVIAGELAASLAAFSERFAVTIPAELYVVADLSGSAAVAATSEDYLIPSCLLNATVSGLVSRSIWHRQHAADGDFHGCVYYEEFKTQDLSHYFVDTILQQVDILWQSQAAKSFPRAGQSFQHGTYQFLQALAVRYEVKHVNYIKPGIGEATRVLLRRQPRLLLLRSAQDPATEHLRWLAASHAIPVEILPDSPYQAIALIKEIEP